MKLNYPAIVLAAVADFALAAGWFTIFAQPWTADLRMSAEEIAYYKAHLSAWPYVIAFICNLVLAYGLACAITRTGDPHEHTIGRGLRLGLAFGIIVAAALITEQVFERHTVTFIGIAAGYPLAGMIVMGTILGAWKGKRATEATKSAGA